MLLHCAKFSKPCIFDSSSSFWPWNKSETLKKYKFFVIIIIEYKRRITERICWLSYLKRKRIWCWNFPSLQKESLQASHNKKQSKDTKRKKKKKRKSKKIQINMLFRVTHKSIFSWRHQTDVFWTVPYPKASHNWCKNKKTLHKRTTPLPLF